jgi:uncharacterized ion transporter superfamily protein YfcC
LIVWGIALAAVLTWLLPAGEYDRRDDPATGRRVVIAGTYHAVTPAPVTPLGAALSIPRGLIAAVDVIVAVLFVGGAFALIESLGTLHRGVATLAGRFRDCGLWAITLVSIPFATLGALENMQEEIIPLVPVLPDPRPCAGRGRGHRRGDVGRSGRDRQRVQSDQPVSSGARVEAGAAADAVDGGAAYRMLLCGFVLWCAWTTHYAARHRLPLAEGDAIKVGAITRKDALILVMVGLALLADVYGALRFGWGFNELSALFFVATIAIGLIGGLGLSGTVSSYLQGMQTVVGASVLIGFARAISVVLSDGRVIDTIVHGMTAPLEHLPAYG